MRSRLTDSIEMAYLEGGGSFLRVGQARRRRSDAVFAGGRQAAELAFDRRATVMGEPYEVGDLEHGLGRIVFRGGHHHGVEPGLDAAHGLCEGVGLVEQERDRHACPLGDAAAECAERLDPASVEPVLVGEQAAEAPAEQEGV